MAIVRKPPKDEKDPGQIVTDPITKLPVIIEDRSLSVKRRSLPREWSEKATLLTKEGVWTVDYQHFSDNGMQNGLSCWKCSRQIMGFFPALTIVDTGKKDEKRKIAVPVVINGVPATTFAPYNFYREGIFEFIRFGVKQSFSYLHCADCIITDADGENLLAIFLSGKDDAREMARRITPFTQEDDNAWASYMYLYNPANIELSKVKRTITVEEMLRGGK